MKNEWMRHKTVDILKYLPFFLSEDKRFKTVNDADSIEHERLRLQVQELLEQLFVETATWGLPLWEQFCGLESDTSIDYKARRDRVLSVLNGKQVVTLDFITYLVNRYVADKSANILTHYDQYYIDIMLPDGKVTDFKELEKMLSIYMPAHLGWKYLAYVKQDGAFYLSGVVSRLSYINVDADTDYNISIDGPAEPNMPGVVSIGAEITIPADLYV